MKINKVLVVFTTPRTKEQKSSLEAVRKALEKFRIRYKMVDRDKLKKSQFKGKDLIIAISGDGTFLRAAQFIDDQPIFGVNADPRHKEGFFMKADKRNFETKLRRVIEGRAKMIGLPRLEAFVNNKRIGIFALNEFFIGPRKAYHAAKYIIKIGNKKERQKSSGVLVATPAGSYSWARSCGGKILPLMSGNFQYIVREPYEGKIFRNYGITSGILGKNRDVNIISEMIDGIIVADSVSREFDFKEGKKAKVKMSDRKIRVIWR